jgi:Response regulator containing a CheY-like receiver domain and an HTH DNA-binding domain
VFLLDDHEIVRRGVRDLLEAEADITVVGEAGTASSALARIPALKPDVASWTCGCRTATGCRCAGRSGPGCPRWPA